MAKKRKKKVVRFIYQSVGPLPLRLAGHYAGLPMVFSDASAKRCGGLAAVLFGDTNAEAIITTQSVPLDASNALSFRRPCLPCRKRASIFRSTVCVIY
jgi:hypothetical protein